MSKTILLLLIAFLPAFSQQKLVLNTAESTINWRGKMWMSTDSHEGIIHFSSGNMTMDKTGKILSANFEINMNTIKTLDARPEKDGLAEHLKSEDFFAVKRFPKAYFVTTKIEKSTVPNNYNVQGNLTIKGILKQVSFAMKMVPMQTSTKATAELTLYRSWWGINYKAPDFFSTLKNDLIAEEVPIKLNLIFSK
ncbi:MAG: YceI family protein [Leadbetterella sp.]|nr:YceI family protein [Leadbetterella sp.]